MHIVEILFQSHRDNGYINLLVSALQFQSLLQYVARYVAHLVYLLRSRHHRLYGWRNGYPCLAVGYPAEYQEENIQQGKTEEHYAHAQGRESESVRVHLLQPF